MMVLKNGKRAKQLILTGILLLFTVSIVLAIPPTITKKTTTTNPPNLPTQTTTMIEGRNNNGEEGAMEWNQTYGRVGGDSGLYVEQTSDGGYIITGFTTFFGVGGDVWLIKTDASGKEVWNQSYGGAAIDSGRCVAQTTPDGGYIITGQTTNTSNPTDVDVWLIKTDQNGNHQWNQTYGGANYDNGYYVKQASDGGYIITGSTESFGVGGSYDVWLIKTDASGNEVWNQTYGGANSDSGHCVEQTTPDGGYIIVGDTSSFGGGWPGEFWLIKTDSEGGHEWNQTYGGANGDRGWCVAQTTPDGGYIITGYTYSFGVGGDVWLIKTNSTGGHEWNQTYGGAANDGGYCGRQTIDGGYIITGYTESFGVGGSTDFWLVKTDASGNEVWNQTYGGTEYDEGYCVKQTSDGGYIIAGLTESFGDLNGDVWLIKVFHDVPVIDHPDDIVYEEGSTGHNITWHPRDPVNPYMFNVTRNDTLLPSGDWDGGDITVNVDGLSLGTYLFTCTVNDTLGFSASDSVTVAVVDTTPPTFIDPPDNITYVEGTTGHNITWRASDNHPSSCTVTMNDTIVPGVAWEDGKITVNVGGLSPATYIYKCTVYDTSGNSASDTVTVTVTEAEEEEGFPWLWLGVGAVVVAAVIGAAVLYFKKE